MDLLIISLSKNLGHNFAPLGQNCVKSFGRTTPLYVISFYKTKFLLGYFNQFEDLKGMSFIFQDVNE